MTTTHKDSRRRPRLTRRGRVLAWIGGVLGVLVLATAGVGGWAYVHLNGNIHGTDVDRALGGHRPAKLSPGAKNILVIGSDTRKGQGKGYGSGLTTMQSDTLLVVHVAANRKWASVVSFPRDSWVHIPSCDEGHGKRSQAHSFKINQAFTLGGLSGDTGNAAACSIKTVEENTDLRIDHFMVVDFNGFKGMVDALGGVKVCPKQAIHDVKAHLDMPAGCQMVKDGKALGYVRARYSVGDGSDLGRINRQQEFMRSLADRAKKKLYDASAMYGFLDSATKSLTTDKDLAGLKPLYGLASSVQGIPQSRLHFLTVPNFPRQQQVPTDKANVLWQPDKSQALFDALRHDREVTKGSLKKAKAPAGGASDGPSGSPSASAGDPSPAAVRVQVLNGTGVTGKAAAVAGQLRSAGFQVTGTGNASGAFAHTAVSYPTGLDGSARTLAGRLAGSVAPQQGSSAAPDVVTLTVGRDWSGVRG